MSKPKLVHFSQDLAACTCYSRIFNTEFETASTDSREEFVEKIAASDLEAAVVCCCSAQEQDINELLRLKALSGKLPVIACSRQLQADFVTSAVQQGVNRFLACTMPVEKIQGIIQHAIRHDDLWAFLEKCCAGSLATLPRTRQMIAEIVHAFPQRLTGKEMADRLGISQSWLQKLCRKAFGWGFRRLLRRIWIYQALKLMQHTTLDNTEIAVQLNYSEESNMARDFRKELDCNPTEARALLATKTPDEILLG